MSWDDQYAATTRTTLLKTLPDIQPRSFSASRPLLLAWASIAVPA